MLDESVRRALGTYLEVPTTQHYTELRDAVAASPEYAPYSEGLEDVHALLEQDDYVGASESIMERMGSWLLNPGIHHMAAYAIHQLGDERRARFEVAVATAMLQGILSTGDGSELRPYLVLRPEDEYDILRHLDKEPRRQSLVQRQGRSFDVQDCSDGTCVWFDVSLPFSQLRTTGYGASAAARACAASAWPRGEKCTESPDR